MVRVSNRVKNSKAEMKKKAPRTKDQGELLLSWHWERQLAWPGWLLAMFRQSLAFPRHLWTIFSQ